MTRRGESPTHSFVLARPLLGFLLLSSSGVALSAGCGSPEPSLACASNLDLACVPLYNPTYNNLFSRTLHPTCAQPGSGCHAAEGSKGGLVFEDADAAYALFLGEKGAPARVIPGDPACSLLVERLESKDPAVVMPPGGALEGPERCAVIQWIKNGAKR